MSDEFGVSLQRGEKERAQDDTIRLEYYMNYAILVSVQFGC